MDVLAGVGEAAVRRAGPLTGQLVVVLGLKVGDVERRGRLGVVEQVPGLALDFVVASRFDSPEDVLEVGDVDVERRVILDELALGFVPGANVAHHRAGIGADAAGEVVDEALAGREVLRLVGVDHDAEVLEAGEARSHLVERPHRGRVPRQELFDVALQVAVERDRTAEGRDREEKGDHPEKLPVTERPLDEGPRAVAGA
jgi:hypothetical protein